MPPLKCISPHKSTPCLKNFEPEDFFKMIEQNRRLLTSSLNGDLVGLYRSVAMRFCIFRCYFLHIHSLFPVSKTVVTCKIKHLQKCFRASTYFACNHLLSSIFVQHLQKFMVFYLHVTICKCFTLVPCKIKH